MKQTIVFFITLIFLTAVLNAVVFKKVPERETQKQIAEVKKYAHPIKNLSFEASDSNDLKMLDSILRGKRIVMLGESTHSDGKTFQAKGRLIKYLHENLGFNVVLYEAGQYDCWLMNEKMNGSPTVNIDAVVGIGLFDFWWKNKENRPLIDYYIRSKSTKSPIELGGFDIQFSGSLINEKKRTALLKNFLSINNINLDTYPTLNKNLANLESLIYDRYANKLDTAQRVRLLDELANLEKATLGLQKTDENIMFSRYLNDIRNNLSKSWKYKVGSMKSMHFRDSLMAENLIYQLDSVYRDKKILIWCANIHAFSSRYNKDYLPLGAYIKNRYGNNAYMMAFSSFGKYNDQKVIPDKPSKYAIENAFHLLKRPYLFLDLKSVPETSLFKKVFVSVLNQGEDQKRRWADLVDGIFYIDVNTEPTYTN